MNPHVPTPGSMTFSSTSASQIAARTGVMFAYGAALRRRSSKFAASGSTATMRAFGNLFANQTDASPMWAPASMIVRGGLVTAKS
jgi:hypothetical protein